MRLIRIIHITGLNLERVPIAYYLHVDLVPILGSNRHLVSFRMFGQVGMYPIIDTPQDQTSSPSDLLVIQRLEAAAGSCYLVETSRCNYTEKIFLIKITVAREQYISFMYFQILVCAAGCLDRGPGVAPENLHKLSHQYLLFINTLLNKKNL